LGDAELQMVTTWVWTVHLCSPFPLPTVLGRASHPPTGSTNRCETAADPDSAPWVRGSSLPSSSAPSLCSRWPWRRHLCILHVTWERPGLCDTELATKAAAVPSRLLQGLPSWAHSRSLSSKQKEKEKGPAQLPKGNDCGHEKEEASVWPKSTWPRAYLPNTCVALVQSSCSVFPICGRTAGQRTLRSHPALPLPSLKSQDNGFERTRCQCVSSPHLSAMRGWKGVKPRCPWSMSRAVTRGREVKRSFRLDTVSIVGKIWYVEKVTFPINRE
jgi:hypothetical protein